MSFTSKQTAFIDAAVSYNETQISVDFDSVSKIELTNRKGFDKETGEKSIKMLQDFIHEYLVVMLH